MEDVDFFVARVNRLKTTLELSKDKEVAEALGLSDKAFNARKARNSFPERELLALAQARPELGIDTHYVFTGERLQDSVAESIKGLTERVGEFLDNQNEAEFAAAWGIATEQLGQGKPGQRPTYADLLKRLAVMYPDDAAYLLTGMRPKIDGPLTAREVVLVTNYRACSDEGRESLLTQAAFLAQYNADHVPVSSKRKNA